MDFDPTTAKPVKVEAFDPSTAQPVDVGLAPSLFTPAQGPTPPPVDYPALYGGVEAIDQHLTPDQVTAFAALSRNTPDPQEARARAVNQSYLQTQIPGMSQQTISSNWQAVKDAYAQHALGIETKGISDSTLYGAIGRQMQDKADEDRYGTITPWTWKDSVGSSVGGTARALTRFWESINKPVAALPAAPENLPNLPQLGQNNPALLGGVYNALKPLVEGVESPFGIATLGVGAELKVLSKTYPMAKAALVGMSGIFTGLMGWQTVRGAKESPAVLNDPNASFQDKVTAIAGPVATGAAAILGAVGTAFEAMPQAEVAPLVAKLAEKTPAEGAEILRAEVKAAPAAPHADFLENAAAELDKIASTTPAKPTAEVAPEPTKTATAAGVKTPEATPALKPIPPDLISIKNETIDAELEKMGEPPATHGEQVTFEAARADAMAKLAADPLAGKKLIAALKENPRPVTGQEDALLLAEQNRLRIDRDAAAEELQAADENGDQAQKMDARVRVANARDAFADAADVVTRVGTANAQGLALRRMMMAEDYSLAAIERRRVAANDGKPLTADQSKEVAELAKKVADTQKAFDDYRAQQAVMPAGRTVARPPSRVSAYLSEQAKAARERIIARSRSGQVSAGIDPAVLADHAIIGADLLARGVTKFGAWSAEMVKEFGNAIIPHLQDLFQRANLEHKDAIRLQALKTRTARSTEELQGRLDTGNLTPPTRRPLPLDAEALRLKAEHERVKTLVDLAEQRDALRNRTGSEKIQAVFVKWVRVGALSWPTVLAKLTGAAAIRTVTTPIEQAVGFGISKLLPELAARAPREGVPELGGALKAEAKAITEGITTGMKGAWDMLHNRESDEAALLDKAHLPKEISDYLGSLHGALKQPTKINEFARSLELRTQHALRNGIDPTDPIQQMRLMHEAWMDANRAIFMQDNAVVDAYRRGVNALTHTNPAKYDATTRSAAQLLATGVQMELPIVKVPTNVIAEASQIMTGWLTGPARAAWEYAHGIEGLDNKPIEADAIMRLMKKGSIGLALTALGFFKAKDIGGFFQPGEKRKETDVQPGDIKAGGVTIPLQLTHNPYISGALAFGATMGRVSDRVMPHSAETEGMASGLVAASLGLIDEIPFVRETVTMGKLTNERTFAGTVNQKAASMLVPGTVQWLAAQFDKKSPFDFTERPTTRKPTGLMQNIEKGIPGLREDLPKDTRKNTSTNR